MSDQTTRSRLWRQIVKVAGGIYDVGLISACVHDRGAFLAWDRVIKWEWRA